MEYNHITESGLGLSIFINNQGAVDINYDTPIVSESGLEL